MAEWSSFVRGNDGKPKVEPLADVQDWWEKVPLAADPVKKEPHSEWVQQAATVALGLNESKQPGEMVLWRELPDRIELRVVRSR
jgi:hypothetical protein